jgi:hypothetical protein
MQNPQHYGYFLALFTVLLYLRVLGQIVVVRWTPRWLPAMEQWQSGLLPYPLLLTGQIVVLTWMTMICIDFLSGSGYFVSPHPAGGRFSILFAYGYALWMVIRYINRMARKPDQRWFGGTIPIIFHCVVAAFLWTWGRYQVS